MKPDIEKIFGQKLQSKVVDLLHTNFDKLFEMIEAKFDEMRESHMRDKEEIIQAI